MIEQFALAASLALSSFAFADDTLTFEAEEWSSPATAWKINTFTADAWNLWSTDKDADKKWSAGKVLQSPVVHEDRQGPEEGAPVLHTVLTGIPKGSWNVYIKHGRSLAVSLDGKTWQDISKTSGRLGRFQIDDGRFELWVDDRFTAVSNPGSSYYDSLILTPALPESNGLLNGGFEAANSVKNSGWTFSGSDPAGSVELSTDVVRSGKRSMKIHSEKPGYWNLANLGSLEVQPHQAWTVSCWVKCRDTDVIELVISATSKDGGSRWDIASDRLSGTKDWTHLQATGRIPPGYDRCLVSLAGDARVLAWVDDVALQPAAATAEAKPTARTLPRPDRRIEEKLDRAILALPVKGGRIYLGWRLLKSDPKDVAFNVYRSAGSEKPVCLNATPLTATTDFIDQTPPPAACTYFVRPVVAGKELDPSGPVVVPAAAGPAMYSSLKLNGNHTVQKIGIADLDGDGRYDYVLKQPNDNIDPWYLYWKPSPDTYKIEAYRHDGTFLWRNDLGWSIERGIWYSPYLVYDFDGNGKAEVAVKTGQGDPRSPDGRVLSGPEYLSIWDGLTGKEITRVDWPSRDGFAGSAGYNYASRNQLGLAYLDGKTPCLLVGRGTYTAMKLVAYQYRDARLEELWRWDNRDSGRDYRGQGAHFMHCADVDDDGRDEVILGSCVIDDDGSPLWSTGLGHPDHCYAGDIDPNHPGLEIYYGIEPGRAANAVCLVDAKTGRILWGINQQTRHVHSTGLCADLDPAHPGMECFSGEKEFPKEQPHRWLHAANGLLLATEKTWDLGLNPRAVYWDADLQHELALDGRIADYLPPPPLPTTAPASSVAAGSHVGLPTPEPRTKAVGRVHTDRIEGSQIAWADILGDWREEIITSLPGELRIYSTTIPATDRRNCLMQHPIYRIDVAHLAMGYPQRPTIALYPAGKSGS